MWARRHRNLPASRAALRQKWSVVQRCKNEAIGVLAQGSVSSAPLVVEVQDEEEELIEQADNPDTRELVEPVQHRGATGQLQPPGSDKEKWLKEFEAQVELIVV